MTSRAEIEVVWETAVLGPPVLVGTYPRLGPKRSQGDFANVLVGTG